MCTQRGGSISSLFSLPQLVGTVRVLCVGDSITNAVGDTEDTNGDPITPEGGWVGRISTAAFVMQDLLGSPLVNLPSLDFIGNQSGPYINCWHNGTNGSTIAFHDSGGPDDMAAAGAAEADIIIYALGRNDMPAGDPGEAAAALTAFESLLAYGHSLNSGARHLACEVYGHPTPLVDAQDALFAAGLPTVVDNRVGAGQNVVSVPVYSSQFIPIANKTTLPGGSFSGGGHPNSQGYDQLATGFWSYIFAAAGYDVTI